MSLDENLIVELAARGVINDTFRRLHPIKKEQIYRQAIRLFGTYGYDGLAVDKICREAGISKGSFFQYFPSKSHLLEFTILVFDDYLSRWVNEIRRGEKAILARDRLRYLYHAVVINSKLYADEQIFYLFVTDAIKHAAVALEGIDPTRHLHEYVRDIIERGERTGEIRGDFDIDLTGSLVSLIIEAMVKRQFAERRLSGTKLEEYFISFLFDGIKA